MHYIVKRLLNPRVMAGRFDLFVALTERKMAPKVFSWLLVREGHIFFDCSVRCLMSEVNLTSESMKRQLTI